jgi:hypothetical protein
LTQGLGRLHAGLRVGVGLAAFRGGVCAVGGVGGGGEDYVDAP